MLLASCLRARGRFVDELGGSVECLKLAGSTHSPRQPQNRR